VSRLPDAVVVDASVALKWLVEEEGSPAAARLLDGPALLAPTLIHVEHDHAPALPQIAATISASETGGPS
jgi:predicted nucleic acid-binding protein